MPLDPSKVPALNRDLATNCDVITGSDGSDTETAGGKYYQYFVAATAGDVSFLCYGNDTAKTITLPAGAMVPGRIRRIRSTGTTATVHGWW